MNNYSLYGLAVQSDMMLPELQTLTAIDAALPITIRQDGVPQRLNHLEVEGILYEANAEEFLITIPHLARYWVQAGQTITVAPEPAADAASVRLFLIDVALPVLLHQRGILPLHGSCIVTPQGAVIFSGLSGAGKSTLAAKFSLAGGTLLTDNVCAIQFDAEHTPYVLPGYPEIHLWAAALDQFDFPEDTTLQRLRPNLEKYAWRVESRFSDQPQRLHAIYILSAVNRGEMTVTPLDRLAKIPLLTKMIYRQRLATELRVIAKHWAALSTFAPQVHLASVTRPAQDFDLEQLAQLVQQDWIHC